MGDHDTLFKRAFGVPEHAAGELRSVLPAAVIDRLDLDALELLPASFVDEEMAHRHADLLFRAPMAGHSSYLYFLLEHQSEPDPLMPWRVLGYIQRIWDAALRAEPGRTTLPPVIAVVVHHGASGWTAPRRLHELVDGLDEVPELAALVPDLELLIDDLVVAGDDNLHQRPLRPFPKVALWLLRDGRRIDDFFEHLAAWAAELDHLVRSDDRADVRVVMRYILRVTGEEILDEVRERITRVVPAAEEAMASAADKLIQQGIQQGIDQGRNQALRDVLARLLAVRFGALEPEIQARLAQASLDELERWIDRVVTADCLADVFESNPALGT